MVTARFCAPPTALQCRPRYKRETPREGVSSLSGLLTPSSPPPGPLPPAGASWPQCQTKFARDSGHLSGNSSAPPAHTAALKQYPMPLSGTKPRAPPAPTPALSSSHAFPLPHLLPRPRPARPSLKPRYTPWPAAPRDDTMHAEQQWAAWQAPYMQQLDAQGWTWNGAWCFAGRPFAPALLGEVPMPMCDDWKDAGIDPRLIYRSPSPGAGDTSSSSPATDQSSLWDSPTGSSESSLPPMLEDLASSDDEEEEEQALQEELQQRMGGACLSPAAEGAELVAHTGGKRKRAGAPSKEGESRVCAGESENGDDEDDDDSGDYFPGVGKKKSSKRPRLSSRGQRKCPLRSQDIKPNPRARTALSSTTPPPASRSTARRPNPAHEQTEIVFSCPYYRSSAPALTCGACFNSETDVRRHAAKHVAQEHYQRQLETDDGRRPLSAYMFGGLEPVFLRCPHSWCRRPFTRKDAFARHVANSCRRRNGGARALEKQAMVEAARAHTLKQPDHWVASPVTMPHRVEAITAKVQGQQKRVITRIVRVLSTYENTYDVRKVKDGEEMEIWWARQGYKGKHEVFKPMDV
ncbi:hypothetical protein CALCODRAFT_175834 [Calocera cornea HHB12733]|uniref:Uncharacterized protein n=1 Tax=Calocera cornea HHB12733 TaxID=1353952 RepID=A0A165HUK9_9BASI|nr:hypothetical protein CALCODRAFT_175834 [Calocera cornea HHB12733]